ncbi:MAG: tryptophan synthase subunit alpha [Endomicrobiaceae bacterium]|nr:tryptophan synthase subunit alpha [Endomicrobiaceae bacterium]
MSKIQNAFKNGKAFIGFLTAGDPSIEKTEEFILEMVKAGTDLIEIGIPFSDPIAEGSVIQSANVRALSAGITTDKIFSMVKSLRTKTNVPIVFLTYLNPVFKYGYEKFFNYCNQVGIDGIIIPDMPFEEKSECSIIAQNNNVDIISMIAPTSEQRIKEIAANAVGYIYVVSSLGVTGMRSEIKTDLNSILKSVKTESSVPVAVGFGINTIEQAKEISKISDGIIVGSAIVKIIEKYGNQAGKYIYEYTKSMKQAIL